MEKWLQWMVARRCRAAQVVVGVASVKVAAGVVQEISPAEVAAGAPSVEVAADAYLAKNQDPEADGGSDDKFSLAPTDPVVPPMSVDARIKYADCGGENCTRLVRKLHSWTRRLRTWT